MSDVKEKRLEKFAAPVEIPAWRQREVKQRMRRLRGLSGYEWQRATAEYMRDDAAQYLRENGLPTDAQVDHTGGALVDYPELRLPLPRYIEAHCPKAPAPCVPAGGVICAADSFLNAPPEQREQIFARLYATNALFVNRRHYCEGNRKSSSTPRPSRVVPVKEKIIEVMREGKRDGRQFKEFMRDWIAHGKLYGIRVTDKGKECKFDDENAEKDSVKKYKWGTLKKMYSEAK